MNFFHGYNPVFTHGPYRRPIYIADYIKTSRALNQQKMYSLSWADSIVLQRGEKKKKNREKFPFTKADTVYDALQVHGLRLWKINR